MYIACYENLAKKVPGPPTALLLGDAYMHIQEVRTIRVLSCSHNLLHLKFAIQKKNDF